MMGAMPYIHAVHHAIARCVVNMTIATTKTTIRFFYIPNVALTDPGRGVKFPCCRIVRHPTTTPDPNSSNASCAICYCDYGCRKRMRRILGGGRLCAEGRGSAQCNQKVSLSLTIAKSKRNLSSGKLADIGAICG